MRFPPETAAQFIEYLLIIHNVDVVETSIFEAFCIAPQLLDSLSLYQLC